MSKKKDSKCLYFDDESSIIVVQSIIRRYLAYCQIAIHCQRRYQMGSKRKKTSYCHDHIDGGYKSEIGNYRDVGSLIRICNKYNIDIDEAIDSLVVTLHFSRRIRHEVSWKYIKYVLIPNLQNASFVKEKCCVILDNDFDKTPQLGFQCPKHEGIKSKACKFNKIQISELISSFETFAQDAIRIGCVELSKEFQTISVQLQAVKLSALHQIVPHRVTMCPGHCTYGAGLVLPAEIPHIVSLCGNKGCVQCGTKTVFGPVRTTTCPAGCTMDDPNGLMHDNVLVQVPLRWCVECGGNHGEGDVCDHKAAYKRLPAEEKKYLEEKVTSGEAQHCPKCYLVQEKASGCDKLKCPECGTKFCLKCGDVLGGDYVTDHLFTIGDGMGVDGLVCRKTVVQKGLAGDAKYLGEIIRAYRGGTRKIIQDVNSMVIEMDPEKIPRPILDILPHELQVSIRAKMQNANGKSSGSSSFAMAVRSNLYSELVAAQIEEDERRGGGY
jgi:hypothetical protein